MSFTEKDKIGRQDIVNKINFLVENLQNDDNFCLALNGEWGSGKSYVMGMLREKFAMHPEYIVINYDAWKNNFYSDPLIAILYCVLDSIKEYAELLPEVTEKVKRGIIKTLKSWGKDTLSAMKQAGGVAAVIACAVEGISNIITASGKLANHNRLQDFRSYQSLLEEVKNQLNNLATTEIYNDKPTKLIIMVDEIDRCLPNEQLIILERIHHLFDVKNCAVIVSLNKTAICANFKTQYGGNGEEYLRKFFTYNFILETGYATLLHNLVMDFIEEINNSKKQNYVYTSQETGPLIFALTQEFARVANINKISYNNRDIKNYFEKFRRVCKADKPLNIAYIGFMLFMVLYKQYYDKEFQEYKAGKWNDNRLKTFTFGGNVHEIAGRYSYPFCYSNGEELYPQYNNDFCNKFTSFMNSVRYRNDNSVFAWFQRLNSTSFYHLYVVDEKSKADVDKCFNTIENYGTASYGKQNEK